MSEQQVKKRHSIVYTMLRIGVIPILLLGIGLTAYSQYTVREGMDYEMERALSGIAHNILSAYNALDGGEFNMKDDTLYKGETRISADYRILDDLKTDTGNDVTIYYGDKRRMTTIVDENGNRLTNTDAPEGVIDHVYGQKEEYFSTDVDIVGTPYYGYYVPIEDDNGDIVGMSFAGKPKDSVMLSTRYMVIGNIIISIFVILLAAFILYLSSSKMVIALQHIKRFLGHLAGGDFTQKMSEEVLTRNDELAEMGEYAVHVEIALDDMISRDPLTKLLNRRATMVRVKNTWEENNFAIAMGDIDWFKGVNDNYGHDMGDEVLRFVAGQLKDELEKSGFVARWGGEEFLIGFDGTQEDLVEHLKAVTGRIRAKVFDTGEKTFSVTMTLGVTIRQPGEEFETVMTRADQLLYKGKTGGRNQIVVDGEEQGIPEGLITE